MRQCGSLKREIMLALVLKGFLLYFLWWGFFSHKPDRQTVASQVAHQFDGADTRNAPSPDFQQATKETTP